MAITLKGLEKAALLAPRISSAILISFGLVLGLVGQEIFGLDLFERFGSVTVALGALMIGSLSTHLHIRGQGSLITNNDGTLPAPYDPSTIRRAQNWQGAAAIFGTIQWGFGGLLFLEECTKC